MMLNSRPKFISIDEWWIFFGIFCTWMASLIFLFMKNFKKIKTHSNENMHCILWKSKRGKSQIPIQGKSERNVPLVSIQIPCITFSCIMKLLLLLMLFYLWWKLNLFSFLSQFHIEWAHILTLFSFVYVFSLYVPPSPRTPLFNSLVLASGFWIYRNCSSKWLNFYRNFFETILLFSINKNPRDIENDFIAWIKFSFLFFWQRKFVVFSERKLQIFPFELLQTSKWK